MTTTASLNGQELELFRAGDYGKKGKYSVTDLRDLATRYSAADQAALTIGHPSSDSEPAWGWIKSVRVDGDKLLGTPGEVNSHFDALVVGGAYKHRSVGVSRGADGKLRLRHVAFLGAVPPAVQGLQPPQVQFSSDPFEEFSLGEGDNMDMTEIRKGVADAIREFFSDKQKETAQIDPAKVTADVTAALEQKFSAELETERAERKRVEAEFTAHKAQFSDADAKLRVANAVSGLKGSGAWVPAYDKLGVEAFFSVLAGNDETVNFSDAEGKEQKLPQLDAAVAIFSAVGRIVPAGQKVQPARAETTKVPAEANGAVVDSDSATFSEMVEQYAKENKVTYNEAYTELSRQGKRPVSGSSAAGAV